MALIARKDNPTYLTAAEEAWTDKQVGGGPQSDGSTSLVVEGSAPTFLGMAVENGALTQSISGTTVMFRGNPLGIVVMETKGNIAVGQMGIKIPIKGTGFRIPISFSFANRTELIKEKEIRGNIGFTFDLDALFSNIKP